MTSIQYTAHFVSKNKRYLARAVALIWAGWWVLFGLASAFSEGISPTGVLLHTAVPGLIFLLSAVIAWRWDVIGRNLLIGEGLLIFIAYPAVALGQISLISIVVVLITMALPPLIAGILLRLS